MTNFIPKWVVLAVAAALLPGCATRPPQSYLPATERSGGYSETKIQEGVFGIHFKGNEYTNLQRVIDFVLLRASEVSLNNGYPYFRVLNEKSDMRTVSGSTPVTTGAACTNRYCFGSTLTAWESYSYQVPATYMMIQGFKERPQDGEPGPVFDAQQVRDNIRTQYDLALNPGSSNKNPIS